jgi:hypothetical protein
MEFKTLTWNIGGGKLLQDGADPLRIAPYAEKGLGAIAGLLESEEPDVITREQWLANRRAPSGASCGVSCAEDLGNFFPDGRKARYKRAKLPRKIYVEHTVPANPSQHMRWASEAMRITPRLGGGRGGASPLGRSC